MTLSEVDFVIALAAAAEAVGVNDMVGVEKLASGGRTVVWRVTDGRASYVMKIFLGTDGSTWAREASALEAVKSCDVAPDLVGVCADPRLIVMKDLGTYPNLADIVLGEDALMAAASLGTWARSLARLHQEPNGTATAFKERLSERAAFQPFHDKPHALSKAGEELQLLAPRLGIAVSDGVTHRLSGIHAAFAVPMDVLSPGDTCPDNNLIQGERLTFLDFEYAEVRHLAWDVAYLYVPWPTCWCAWGLPSEVAEHALNQYSDEIRSTLPYVDSPDFDHDLQLATLGWCLESAAMFLQGALSPEAATETTKRRPGRRALVLSRLAQASSMQVDSYLSDLGGRLHSALLQEWGPVPLDRAPAFSSHSDS